MCNIMITLPATCATLWSLCQRHVQHMIILPARYTTVRSRYQHHVQYMITMPAICTTLWSQCQQHGQHYDHDARNIYNIWFRDFIPHINLQILQISICLNKAFTTCIRFHRHMYSTSIYFAVKMFVCKIFVMYSHLMETLSQSAIFNCRGNEFPWSILLNSFYQSTLVFLGVFLNSEHAMIWRSGIAV